MSQKKAKEIIFETEAEFNTVCENSPNLQYVLFEGIVYDVSEYMSIHPGGADLIEEYLGKSIDDAFNNQEHSKRAR